MATAAHPPAPRLVGYPGSKAASGVAERIIRQRPPHRTFIEPFAGYAAVWRRKRPADHSILIDADPNTCETLRSYTANSAGLGRAEIICEDALVVMGQHPATRRADTLLFADPPYLRSVRTRLLYDVEFADPESHTLLLDLLLGLRCMVMISHYPCPLYRKKLRKWRSIEIPAMTRGGKRIEQVWCNFDEPDVLHDPRFAGGDYRQRENIAKKKRRWKAKFEAMEPRERQAIAAALVDVDRAAVEAAVGPVTKLQTDESQSGVHQ